MYANDIEHAMKKNIDASLTSMNSLMKTKKKKDMFDAIEHASKAKAYANVLEDDAYVRKAQGILNKLHSMCSKM